MFLSSRMLVRVDFVSVCVWVSSIYMVELIYGYPCGRTRFLAGGLVVDLWIGKQIMVRLWVHIQFRDFAALKNIAQRILYVSDFGVGFKNKYLKE